MNNLFLKNLMENYQSGQDIISKDLNVVNKKDVTSSSIFKKFAYWLKGSFNAKKTAESINKFMESLIEKDGLSRLDDKQKKTIIQKLNQLDSKFSQKGVHTLKKTIKKLEESLPSIKKPVEQKPSKSKTSTSSEKTASQQQTSQSKKVEHKDSSKPKTSAPSEKAVSQQTSQSQKVKPQGSVKTETAQSDKTALQQREKQLKVVQNQIDNLDAHSPQLFQKAREILTSLKTIVKDNPQLEKDLSPLIKTMTVIEKDGVLAFHPTALQESFFKEFNQSKKVNTNYDRVEIQGQLQKLLNFLKTTDRASSKSIEQQLIDKSSHLKTKWSELENQVFTKYLGLDKEPKMKANILEMKALLTDIQEQLSKDYKNKLQKIQAKPNYQRTNLERHTTKDSILNKIMANLVETIAAHVALSENIPKESLDSIKGKLYEAAGHDLTTNFEAQLKNAKPKAH